MLNKFDVINKKNIGLRKHKWLKMTYPSQYLTICLFAITRYLNNGIAIVIHTTNLETLFSRIKLRFEPRATASCL